MYSLIPASKTACLPYLRLLTFDTVTAIHGEEDYMPPRILTIKAGINRCYLISARRFASARASRFSPRTSNVSNKAGNHSSYKAPQQSTPATGSHSRPI